MNIDNLRTLLRKGGAHLGDIIFWMIAEARIERVTLERVWADHGLDAALLPEPVSAAKALKLAIRECQTGQRERLIRLARENESTLVFGVVRESRLGDDLAYEQEARVHLDKEHETLTSDQPGHDLVASIMAAYRIQHESHGPEDVRRSVVKAVASFAGCALRPSGGIYWAPNAFAQQVRHLQVAVEKIGSSRFYVLPVHESVEARQTLSEIAQGSLEEELSSLVAEIEGFVAAPPERASTLVRRFDAFEALRSRAKLYRSVLAVEVQNLDEKLDQLSTAVEQMLDAKQGGDGNVAAAPLAADPEFPPETRVAS